MKAETIGTVVSVSRQWWLKINTKTIRHHALDGTAFPYIIKVAYAVGTKKYIKMKWINPGCPVPAVGSNVQVRYCPEKPSKSKIN